MTPNSKSPLSKLTFGAVVVVAVFGVSSLFADAKARIAFIDSGIERGTVYLPPADDGADSGRPER